MWSIVDQNIVMWYDTMISYRKGFMYKTFTAVTKIRVITCSVTVEWLNKLLHAQ